MVIVDDAMLRIGDYGSSSVGGNILADERRLILDCSTVTIEQCSVQLLGGPSLDKGFERFVLNER